MGLKICRVSCSRIVPCTLLLQLGLYLFIISWNNTENRNYDMPNIMERKIKGKEFCSGTRNLFLGTHSIESAIKNARQWHNGGGNLKALQLHLDKQIASTMAMNDISFLPHDGVQQQILGEDIEPYILNYFKENQVLRAGYGKFLPGKLKKPSSLRGNGGVWEDRFIEVNEPWSYDRWNASIGPIGPACRNVIQLGNGYESKYFCDWALIANKNLSSPLQHAEECHILSIGSNDQWGFEVDLLRQTNCIVHTFDCTLMDGTPKNKPNNERVKFYNFCIGFRNETFEGRQYGSFSELWKKTGSKSAPKLVKMDVEGFEYDVITAMISEYRSGLLPEEFLPEQIIVELHWATKMADLSWILRTRGAGEISLFVGILFSAGYMPVYTHFDPGCVPCLEVLFVRVICSS